MNLSELIAKLKQIEATHGDLPVHDTAHFLVENVRVITATKDEFPEDWNMPEGYQFIQIGEQP